jgi:hypothetical protein
MADQFIGGKKIKDHKVTKEKTPGDMEIVCVNYDDGSMEYFSKVMFDNIVTTEAIDATALREKRINPMVNVVLSILREYGIKIGELPYFSSLLNQSLNYNSDQALIELISQYMPKPNSLDDVDLITVDRILKAKKQTVQDVIEK